MQTGPVGFDAAVTARTPLAVTAPVTDPAVDVASASGWAESIEIVRELSGELPESASIVIGGASAALTVRGDARAAGAPSPLRPAEARTWLGSDVDVEAGWAGLTVPLFSGKVSDLDASEDSRELVLEARDAADRLTAPVKLHAYGSFANRVSGVVARHPVNVAAVITAILHSNGIRMVPAPRYGCELSVPGVGGWLADIGWVVPRSGSAGSSWLEEGRFGPAPGPTFETIGGFFANRRTWGTTGDGMIVECFVNITAGMSRDVLTVVHASGWRFIVRVASGEVRLLAKSPTLVETLLSSASIATGWRHIAARFRQGMGTAAWVDGASVISSTSWPVAVTASDIDYVSWDSGGVQAVAAYWGTTAVPDSSVVSFAPEADVSACALDLASVPDVDGRASWDVLKEIAEAELGMVGFSEAGRFFFRSRADIAAAASPVALWGTDLVDDVRAAVSLDSVITRATAKVVSRVGVWSGLGAETAASTAVPSLLASDPIEVPPGASSVIVSGDVPVLPLAQRVQVITLPGGAWNTQVGMVLCNDADGFDRYTGSSVSAWLAPISTTSLRVTFANASGSTKYVVWPAEWSESSGYDVTPFDLDAGSPALWVLGYSYPAGAGKVIDRSDSAGVAAWGDRVHSFGESEWWQDAATLEAFVDDFLADTTQPRATVQEITVPADPRWQLGDTVNVTDWDGRVPGFLARITSARIVVDRSVEHGIVGTYGLRQVVGTLPIITVHPASTSVSAGSTVTFTAAATGATGYQWQRDIGAGFVDVAGATSASYTTGALAVADSGARFRCVCVNASGSDVTRPAVVTVTVPSGTAPSFTGTPLVYATPTVFSAEPAQIGSVSVAGSPAPSLTWESRIDSGAWSATTATLISAGMYSVAIVGSLSAYPGQTFQVRITASNGVGSPAVAVTAPALFYEDA